MAICFINPEHIYGHCRFSKPSPNGKTTKQPAYPYYPRKLLKFQADAYSAQPAGNEHAQQGKQH